MGESLLTQDLLSFLPGSWGEPFSLTGNPGEMILIQGTQIRCNLLFELLCGLRLPDQGAVTILGNDIYKLPEQELVQFRCRHIGGIPRGGGLMPELRLIDQVTLPMRLAGLSDEEIRNRIRGNAFDYLPVHSLYNPASRSTERTKALTMLLQATIMGQKILIFHSPFDELSDTAAGLVWKQLMEVREKDSLLLYLSSSPVPLQITWTSQLRI